MMLLLFMDMFTAVGDGDDGDTRVAAIAGCSGTVKGRAWAWTVPIGTRRPGTAVVVAVAAAVGADTVP